MSCQEDTLKEETCRFLMRIACVSLNKNFDFLRIRIYVRWKYSHQFLVAPNLKITRSHSTVSLLGTY